MASMADIVPSIQSTINHADSLIQTANKLMSSPKIEATLANVESITTELNETSNKLNKMIEKQIPPIINNVNTISSDLKTVTGELSNIQYKEIIASLDSTITNLQKFTEHLKSPKGTLGLLLNDKSLYNTLDTTLNSANRLLIDFRENPRNYLYPFGKKNKQKK